MKKLKIERLIFIICIIICVIAIIATGRNVKNFYIQNVDRLLHELGVGGNYGKIIRIRA